MFMEFHIAQEINKKIASRIHNIDNWAFVVVLGACAPSEPFK